MAAEVVRIRTIHRVFGEFLNWRGPSLEPDELRRYREVLALFEDGINDHAVECLGGADDRPRDDAVAARRFTEISGPEKILFEITHFLRDSLYDYSPRADVVDLAPSVIADLCSWLVWKGYVSDSEMEESIDEIGSQEWSPGRDSVNF